jgi:hypothetical protein
MMLKRRSTLLSVLSAKLLVILNQNVGGRRRLTSSALTVESSITLLLSVSHGRRKRDLLQEGQLLRLTTKLTWYRSCCNSSRHQTPAITLKLLLLKGCLTKL